MYDEKPIAEVSGIKVLEADGYRGNPDERLFQWLEREVEKYPHVARRIDAVAFHAGSLTIWWKDGAPIPDFFRRDGIDAPDGDWWCLDNEYSETRYEKNSLDYSEYIKSPEWKKRSEEAKKRAGQRCQICNRPRGHRIVLDAHHRTYERFGNELPEDITVLCRECHEHYKDKLATY